MACQQPTRVVMQNVHTSEIKWAVKDCGLWRCDHCADSLRDKHLKSLSGHFREQEQLWAAWVPLDRRKAVYYQIKRRGGEYVCIVPQSDYEWAGQECLYISSIRFSGAESHTPDDAVQTLASMFPYLEKHGTAHPVSTSQGWALPKPVRGESDWKVLTGGLSAESFKQAAQSLGHDTAEENGGRCIRLNATLTDVQCLALVKECRRLKRKEHCLYVTQGKGKEVCMNIDWPFCTVGGEWGLGRVVGPSG